MKIVVTFNLPDKYIHKILECDQSIRVEKSTDESELLDLIRDADVAFVGPFTQEMARAAGKLRWVQSTSAGVDKFFFPEFLDKSVVLTNSSGIHRIQISEHVLCFMLCFTRRFHRFIRHQSEKKWERIASEELSGKTVGILGLGDIGDEVASKTKALDMRVLALDKKQVPKPEYVDELLYPEKLSQLLTNSDFLVVAVPLTEETIGMISSKELRRMKREAYIINISRGKVIVQKDLIEALNEGWIAGAGLDVFEEEPLPTDSPLWEMENVIITPHIAGSTPYYWERATNLFCKNVKRFISGKPLTNVVDKDAQY